jgi:hypothetical protein
MLPEGVAEAYETLRPSFLDPAWANGSIAGRAVLLRHGMAAWALTWDSAPSLPALTSRCAVAGSSLVPSEIAGELVRVIAGLVLGGRKEHCHA